MKAYASILRMRFLTLLQYRAAALAGFGTQMAWGFMKVMILGAFYSASTGREPISYPQVVTYIWLGQGMLAMLPWSVDPEMKVLIRTGGVVYELLRPLDLYSLWFSRAVALRVAPTLLRATPMFIVTGLFLGLQPPPSWASGAAFAVSITCALLLSAAITALLGITLLWTLAGEGVTIVLVSGVVVCSGMVIPLPLFPDWAQRVFSFLPFRGLVDLPYRLYCGNLPPEALFPVVAQQLAWTLALVALGRWLLSRGIRRMVAQGG